MYSKRVIYDQTGKIEGFYTSKNFPEKIRKVKFFDADNKKMLLFLTKNFDLSAQQITYYISSVGRLNYSLNGLNNILKLKPFGEQQKMLFVYKLTSQ